MVRITDQLAAGPTLSFEFSAPRDEQGQARLERALRSLASLKPSFMSVTYGAGGSTRGPTEAVAAHIQDDLGVTAMPHLTCVSHTRDEIEILLGRYDDEGIENLLALRGDLPTGTDELSSGHFALATELVRIVRAHGNFAVGVAAHPEMHPLAESPDADLAHQSEKISVADFAITQFFFKTEYYERFREGLAARSVFVPVIPGIMPPTNAGNIARMSAMNRTEFPVAIREQLEAAGDDLDARREIGIETATQLGEELLAAGAPGLHLYTLNFSQIAIEVVRRLGLRESA
jgi:methylenetetrahydrofolate reductase (NADPH)